MFDTAAVLTVIAALFGYLNHRTLKLPFAIGIMIGGLLASAVVVVIDVALPDLGLGSQVLAAVHNVDFPTALLKGMLSFLLFAGALHVRMDQLKARIRSILTLASVGVVISTALIGVGSYLLFDLFGHPLPFAICLVFGALASPTDPVAVLGIMKAAGASEDQEVTIVGESLLNDGVGVLLFTVLVIVATGTGHGAHGSLASEVGLVLLREVGGGVLLGLCAGYLTFRAMRSMDEPHLESLISVALVMGITYVALQAHFSAPLACVVAGLFIGNQARAQAMSHRTQETLDLIWEFIDEALNAVLFLLVGLEVVSLYEVSLTGGLIAASVAMVVLSLLARLVSVTLPLIVFRRREGLSRGAIPVLTWGGLKGGISVALALSLPDIEGRAAILTATYAIVIFSIVVQGLTVGKLVQWIRRHPDAAEVG